ncbi:helix-turn-helix transcriptional regulator [Streptomyces sp. NPDC051173]|uniref:helix-turn-helix domain-containing protein n=1 Tax=Streptomyces sp. NPDC051173 TaxID=3155164 RepID=UPI0034501BA3
MTGELANPPTAWRYCGNQMKLWRTEAGVSREELATETGYGAETIKSMEQGRRRPTLRVLEIADDLCGAQGKLKAAYVYLQPEPFVPYAREFMLYEGEAIALSSYQPLLIPGLLQTESTMRTLFNTHWPPLTDETVEERVKARLARQAILQEQAKAFSFVIGEAALRNTLGCPEAHRRQLLHLLQAAEQRNIVIQVLPIEGAHPGLDGSFLLLETPERKWLVYEEGQIGSSLCSDPERISDLTQRHAMIARYALSPEESTQFIRKLAESL